MESSYDNVEILNCISTLLSGQLTMGDRVKEFEKAFSDFLNVPYSIMVNSGSSANLLAFSVITNPYRENHLQNGDKVAVPAVCWSTSLWPIIQTGLVPVLIDVEPDTLNMSIESLKRAMSMHDIKAVMMVHVLGNSTDFGELLELVRDNDLILVEDTCESLGSKYKSGYLGGYGDLGTFSFYFSHHMTTIEGGMVTAATEEDLDLLRCMRTHGWSREQSKRAELEKTYDYIDPRFLFVNMGYNLRPMEIQAAFGLEQIKRLESMNQNRKINFRNIVEIFRSHPLWDEQLIFPRVQKDIEACWFGFPFLVSGKLNLNRKLFIDHLLSRSVDTRPIVSGNMALQPAIHKFNVDLSLAPFEGAQEVHDRGFFIGCHSNLFEKEKIENLVTIIMEGLVEHI
ncbi:MAG: DegT/DnrJ/EryC1/StrS family aminotransferase [Planctomycetota bacterium]